MVSFLLIVKTLESTNISVRGLGQVVVDPATIEVGNNAVVARCKVEGLRGYKTIKCYHISGHRADTKSVTHYPKSLAVYGFSGRVEYIDVAISSWIDGRPLDVVFYSGGCDIKALSVEFDKMALEHLQSGIIHGDIKPENIIVLKSGKMKLVDGDELPENVGGNCHAKDYGSEYYAHPLRRLRRTDVYTDHYPLAFTSSLLAALVFEPKLFDTRSSIEEYIAMATDVLAKHNDTCHYNLIVAMRKSIMGKVEAVKSLFESIIMAHK